MKKAVLILFSFIFAAVFLTSCSKTEGEKIRIGLEELVPYCGYDENGEADGFYVQALKIISKNAGFSDVEFVVSDHSDLLSKLKSGEIDCFASKNYPENGTLQKSDCFYYSGGAILIDEENKYMQAQTLRDMADAKVCGLTLSAEKDTFDFEKAEYFDTLQEVEEAMGSGDFDAFAGDYLVARAFRVTAPTQMSLRLFPDVETKGENNCHYLYFTDVQNRFIEKLNSAISDFDIDDAMKIAEEKISILSETEN